MAKLTCIRCGEEKKKGFSEGGCVHWGTFYPKHLFKRMNDCECHCHIKEEVLNENQVDVCPQQECEHCEK